VQLAGVGVAVGVVLALLSGAWFHGRDTGREQIRADWARATLAAQARYQALERKHRALEAAHRQTVEDNDRAYREARRQQEAQLDAVLADLRGDNLRLRHRLRGCAATAGADSDRAAGPGADAAAPAGLSRADEEFLVRLAADADAQAARLAHLQAYVQELPAVCGPPG
jgi:hypothetical protein